MPCYLKILCPHCQSDQIVKAGFTPIGKQRYRCKNDQCETKTFLHTYSYRGHSPETKEKIIDMAINGSGIRDPARVLKVSQWLVMEEIKKKPPAFGSSMKS